MTPTECVALCKLASTAFPHQAIDRDTPKVWLPLLSDLRVEDARDAVVEIAKRERFVSPADIRREVGRVRARRLEVAGELVPPRDLDPDDVAGYQRWLRGARRDAADGTPPLVEVGMVSAPARMRALVAAASPKAEVE